MVNRELSIEDFRFLIEKDSSADPLSGIAVWVMFRQTPCCDENGHQYRFYLPLGVADSTIDDVCSAFTLATHCNFIGQVSYERAA